MFNPKTFRSLEFLLVVVANIAGWLLTLTSFMPTEYGVYLTAGSAAVYAIERGLAKMGADTKDYWATTEFWVALVATVPTVIAAFADVIPGNVYGILQATILVGLGIGNGLRKEPMVASGALNVDDLAPVAEGDFAEDGDDTVVAP